MKFLLLIPFIVVLLAIGLSGQSQNEEQEPAEFDPEKYYTEFYSAVVEAMVDQGMKNEDNFDDEKRTELITFIYNEQSVEKFAEQYGQQYYEFLESVKASGHFEGTEIERAISATDSVEMPLAMMRCSGCIDIYSRKILHPDFTAPYFENAESWDEETIISWIINEVKKEGLEGLDLGSFNISEGDLIYHFSSPPVTWNIMTGREGYAVIRDDKLVHHIITVMKSNKLLHETGSSWFSERGVLRRN